MGKTVTALQDLIEPVVAGFWGETESLDGRVPCRVVRNGDVAKSGYIPRNDLPIRFFTEYERDKARVLDGDIVLVSSGAYTGNAGLVVGADDGLPVVVSNFVRRLRPKHKVAPGWLFHLIRSDVVQRYVPAHTGGSAIPNLQSSLYAKCNLAFVPGTVTQKRIAEILSTVDEAIDLTESFIAKTREIKAGLMHDLFTRGVTPDGRLRPAREDAPHLYHEVPVGWSPKAWASEALESLLAPVTCPMRSGPFGSALLKDELVENGIPLLGIDNIFTEMFVGEYRRFVTPHKFVELSRYAVLPGDVIITIMGTVGRCCVVPEDIGPALSSKHLWTITFDRNKLLPELACWQLNHAPWVKSWFARQSQGAVMDAIQSSTLRTLRLRVPPPSEQLLLRDRYATIQGRLAEENEALRKLKNIKRGLMQDLLTGRVPVAVDTKRAVGEVAANV